MVIFKGLSRNKCSVILGNGGGTSYASTLLIDKMNKIPSKMKVGNTGITLHTITKNYHVDVSNVGDYHSFQLKVKNTDKRVLPLCIEIDLKHSQDLCSLVNILFRDHTLKKP